MSSSTFSSSSTCSCGGNSKNPIILCGRVFPWNVTNETGTARVPLTTTKPKCQDNMCIRAGGCRVDEIRRLESFWNQTFHGTRCAGPTNFLSRYSSFRNNCQRTNSHNPIIRIITSSDGSVDEEVLIQSFAFSANTLQSTTAILPWNNKILFLVSV